VKVLALIEHGVAGFLLASRMLEIRLGDLENLQDFRKFDLLVAVQRVFPDEFVFRQAIDESIIVEVPARFASGTAAPA